MAGEIVRFVRKDPIANRGLSMADDRMWRLDVKPKDIYVAASLLNQENALRFSLRLQDAGFQVSLDPEQALGRLVQGMDMHNGLFICNL